MLELIGILALLIAIMLTFLVVYRIYTRANEREKMYFKSCKEKDEKEIDFPLDENNMIYESNLNYTENKFLEEFNYDTKKVIDKTYEVFRELLIEREHEDIKDIKNNLSEDLFKKYNKQLFDNLKDNKKRVFKDIKCYKGIVEAFYNQNAEVTLYLSYVDYMIDINTKEIIRGTKEEKLHIVRLKSVVSIDSFILVKKQKIFEIDLNSIYNK